MSASRRGSGHVGASRRGADGGKRSRSGAVRIVRAWRALPPERRLAAAAAIALFLTLFLNWYQETVIAGGSTGLRTISVSLTGWQAFSFVEAAVLLVAAGVLTLLFVRAERHAFHVPGGDGGVITAAGGWACVLIVWRIFDKEGTTGHGQYASTSGVEWGIFVALAVAAMLTYAGSRIRHARDPEPPLPGEPAAAAARRQRRGPEMDADDTWIEHGPVPKTTAGRSRRPTVLDPREIQHLKIAEPPTARIGRDRATPPDRAAPAGADAEPGSDRRRR